MLLTAERFQAICYPFSHRAVFDGKRVKTFIITIWIVALIPSLYIGFMVLWSNKITNINNFEFKRVVTDFCGYNRQMNYVGQCDLVTSPDSFFRYPFETAMAITFVLPLFFIIYCYFRILGTYWILQSERRYMTIPVTLNEMSNSTHVHTPVGTARSDSGNFQFPNVSNNSNNQSFPLTVHTKNVQPPRSQQAQRMVIKMLGERKPTN